MDIGRRLEEIKREQAKIEAAKAEKKRLQREKTAKKNAQLADKLNDPELFVACVVWCLARCPAEQEVDARPIMARQRLYSHNVRWHLRAARKILGIKYGRTHVTYRLPSTYRGRLQKIGLYNPDDPYSHRLPVQRSTEDLIIDDTVKMFADKYPDMLSRAQSFLRGEVYDPGTQTFSKPEIEPPTLTDCLQAQPANIASAIVQRQIRAHFDL
jgi:hypothetical protein